MTQDPDDSARPVMGCARNHSPPLGRDGFGACGVGERSWSRRRRTRWRPLRRLRGRGLGHRHDRGCPAGRCRADAEESAVGCVGLAFADTGHPGRPTVRQPG